MVANLGMEQYRQERNVLLVYQFNASAVAVSITIGTAPFSGVVATYAIPSARALYVDFSDIIRILPAATLTISELDSSQAVLSSQTLTYDATIWRNPEKILHPEQELQPSVVPSAYEGWDAVGCMYIYPPSYLIEGGAQMQIYTNDYPREKAYYFNNNGTITNIQEGWATLVVGSGTPSLYLGTYAYPGTPNRRTSWAKIPIIPQDPCKEYGRVYWTDRFGLPKSTYMEIRNLSARVTDSVQVQNVQRDYDIRKSYSEGVVLHLGELTAYDVWYYADILTSPNVRVTLANNATYYIDVQTDSIDIPNTDTGEKHELNIEVKIGDYVAI